MSYPTVLEVTPGSPAALAGFQIGDSFVTVNGVCPSDVIEYQQLIDEPDLVIETERDGIALRAEIEKRAGEPLGLRLDSSIFDRVQTCDNHCEFCFIYQLPPGMRKSLYLKDDDYRLSFLYGNFTTLTRFTELDLSRVVEERLGPLYVSIHTTDPAVRSEMLRNPRGATSLRWLRALLDSGIVVHGQIVLCPAVNGGDVLERTLAEIVGRYNGIESVGIVPLGISKYNTEPNLIAHTEETARRDLEIVSAWQDIAMERHGRRLFFASDELYLLAGMEIPATEEYEEYAQHENGIGMVRAFYDELDRIEFGSQGGAPVVTGEWRSIPAAPALGYRAFRSSHDRSSDAVRGDVVVLTGRYGRAALEPVVDRLQTIAGRTFRLLEVENRFFAGNVGVAGLMVGEDLVRTLETDAAPAGVYLIPDVAVVGDTFLDNVSIASVAAAAKASVRVVETTVAGLLEGAAA
jgi:putative radical SAM enzyme (TIGR03279 family)